MSNQGAKTTLMAVATATVVVASIYITYKQRRLASAARRAAPRAIHDPTASTEAQPVAGQVRAGIGAFRTRVHGVIGNLGDVQRRVTGEGEQVVARLKLGRDGRRLPDIDLTSEAPTPTMQPSPQGRP